MRKGEDGLMRMMGEGTPESESGGPGDTCACDDKQGGCGGFPTLVAYGELPVLPEPVSSRQSLVLSQNNWLLAL